MKKAPRYKVLKLSDLQSGAEELVYVTDADATKLEEEIRTLRQIMIEDAKIYGSRLPPRRGNKWA